MRNKFLSKIDSKKFKLAFKLTISVLILVLVVNIIDITYSRYQSNANMSVEANIALFLVDAGTYSGSITLEGLVPSNEPHIYKIIVKNHNDDVRTDVDLTYKIKFETTTNLPLRFEVYKDEDFSDSATDILTASSYRQDGDVYYKIYENSDRYEFHYNEDEEDVYTVVVYYPEEYKNYPDQYQGKVELLTVIIDAEQVA